MWIITTAGSITAVEAPENAASVRVSSFDRDSIQVVVDGVEMIAGSQGPVIHDEEGELWVTVSKADFAKWLAFEALSYINYVDFEGRLDTT